MLTRLKGNIEKYAKSGGLHDWQKKKFSFHQSPETSGTANVSAQQKSSSSQSGQNGHASTIARFKDQLLKKIIID